MVEVQEGCRICGEEYSEILDLGEIYPSTFVTCYCGQQKAPLTLVRCDQCGLVQLKHTVDLPGLYQKHYWYKSGLNNSMVDSLRDVVVKARELIDLYTGDVVVDIGANDGTLLSFYPDKVTRIGVDPASNLKEELAKHCDYVVDDFFPTDKYPSLMPRAKIITSIAVFYDLPDPGAFVEGILKILNPHGIWIVQMTDLRSMLETNAFDNICHEHLEYYSIEVMIKLLEKYGLRVFDIEYNDVNGRSIRYYIDRGIRRVKPSVSRAWRAEDAFLHGYTDRIREFAKEVEEIRLTVRNYLIRQNMEGKVVYGMGASTKGNTLLQYFGLGNNLITCIAEINEDKYGLMTIGTDIPIFPQELIGTTLDYPDIYFVLPWHFIDNFIEKNQEFLDWGGKFMVPLPHPVVIYKNWEGKLEWTYL